MGQTSVAEEARLARGYGEAIVSLPWRQRLLPQALGKTGLKHVFPGMGDPTPLPRVFQISGIPYETWTAIAGSTIWLKFFGDFIVSRQARANCGKADKG